MTNVQATRHGIENRDYRHKLKQNEMEWNEMKYQIERRMLRCATTISYNMFK